jgi:tRNA(Ile)-lysidine synthase
VKPPPPAAVARFAAELGALCPRPGAEDAPLALAVSGGPDSMAMLALAAAALPGRIVAATVDHRLRDEAAAEAALVAQACECLGVAHAVLAVPAPPPAGANLHGWARQERYRLLGAWAEAAGAVVLATAHHADDQAETFLLRANRASGLPGLAGIRAAGPLPGGAAVTLIRPLLGWRRAALREVAEGAGLGFADDPSNADPRFDRARIRRLLAERDELDPAALARAARHLAEAEADLDLLARRCWAERAVAEHGEVTVRGEDLPRTLQRRLAALAIEQVARGAVDRGANLESLLDALAAGSAATQGPVEARAGPLGWRFRLAPPRRHG